MNDAFMELAAASVFAAVLILCLSVLCIYRGRVINKLYKEIDDKAEENEKIIKGLKEKLDESQHILDQWQISHLDLVDVNVQRVIDERYGVYITIGDIINGVNEGKIKLSLYGYDILSPDSGERPKIEFVD